MKWNCCLVVLLISIWGSVGNGQKSPTVFPAESFNPVKDAAALLKAMKGIGTDEGTIIQILAKRCTSQRLDIAKSYKTAYGKDLIDDLNGELSGSLRNAIEALFYPLPELYAKELYDAMVGVGTDEKAIIEILTSQSDDEIKTISQLYQQRYGNTLEADLKGDTSGNFQRLCISLVQGNRNENQYADQTVPLADATALFKATEVSTFNSILVTRSYQKLPQIFTEYEKLAKISIEKGISNITSGSTASGFLAIVQWSKSKNDFYADRLYNALNGWTVDHKTLTRIVVGRSELNLGAIEQAFQAKYGKSLESRIREATSGDYRDVLVLLASGAFN